MTAASIEPVAQLFSEHGDFVFRTLQYLGVDSPALDDGVQDVFVIAYRRSGTFEGRSSVRTWLYGIARRVAYRYRRTHRNQTARFVLTEGVVEGADDPFERVNARRSVMALLERLDEPKRAVFVLVAVEGFSAAEAAALLEIPLGTVYSRLRAAWARVRDEANQDVELTTMRVSMERERRSRVQRAVVTSALSTAVPPATAAWGVLSWFVGAAVGGATVAVTLVLPANEAQPRRHDAPVLEAPSPARVEPPTVAAPVAAPVPEVFETAEPSPRTRSRSRSSFQRDVRAPRPTSKGTFSEELGLIRRAKEFDRDGNTNRALETLEQHQRRFPDGQLKDERDALRRTLLQVPH